MQYLPEIRTIWNNDDIITYTDRWVYFGAWSQPDPCAPAEGICTGGIYNGQKCTTANRDYCESGSCEYSWNNYEKTFGPNGNGGCIIDTDPTDGIGRHPYRHGLDTDQGIYDSDFVNELYARDRISTFDTCLNYFLDPGESDIDCGGPCPPCGAELCNGLEDDGDLEIDEGCDDDNDDYCDSSMTTVGNPAVCPNGGNDCNDNDDSIYPNANEACDLLDNQCTGDVGFGQIDEGCTCTTLQVQSCGTSDVGACTFGTQTCLNGIWDVCTGVTLPQAETCNNIDDNCDGTVDEMLYDCDTAEIKPPCKPDWQCSEWSECSHKRRKSRTCTDINECGSLISRPSVSSACFSRATEPEVTTAPSIRRRETEETPETIVDREIQPEIDEQGSTDSTFFWNTLLLIAVGTIIYFIYKKGIKLHPQTQLKVRDLLKENIIEMRKNGKSDKEIIEKLKRNEFDEKTIREKLK